jgi:GNAT superfamily N-acetyltransferase
LNIVLYTESLDQAHYEFASRHWKKKVRLDKNYILWKYRNISDPSKTMLILAINDEGGVVGQLGLVNVKYTTEKGEEVPVFWFCDLMVDHEYRGKGLSKQLYDFVLNTEKGLFLGSNPSKGANVSMAKMGFKGMPGGHKYILPVSLTQTLGIKMPSLKKLGFIPNLFFWPVKALNSGKKFDIITDINQFPEISTKPGIKKDRNFLQWRLIDRPLYKVPYFLLKLKDTNSSLLVYKTTQDYVIGNMKLEKKQHFIPMVCKLFSMAQNEKMRSVRFYATDFGFSALFRKFFINMNEANYILWLDKWGNIPVPDVFHYTSLDSDENI